MGRLIWWVFIYPVAMHRPCGHVCARWTSHNANINNAASPLVPQTTTPNSQPRHHKQMQVKGPNDDKCHLGPKSKFPNSVFYVLLTVLHRFATIDIAHPCSVPMSSILTSSILTLSVPTHLCPRRPHEPLLAGGQRVQLLRGNDHPQLPHHIAPPMTNSHNVELQRGGRQTYGTTNHDHHEWWWGWMADDEWGTDDEWGDKREMRDGWQTTTTTNDECGMTNDNDDEHAHAWRMGGRQQWPMDGDDEHPSRQSTTMTTTVPTNTGDCDNEPFILFNVHSSKYSITPRHVETQYPTGFNWLRPVSYTTGLNRLGYNNRTNLNWLYVVQSGFPKLRVQSEPVAVAVAPDQGPKTGLNRTFKH